MGPAGVGAVGSGNADQGFRLIDGAPQIVGIRHGLQPRLVPEGPVLLGAFRQSLSVALPGVKAGIEGLRRRQGLGLSLCGGGLQDASVRRQGLHHRQRVGALHQRRAILVPDGFLVLLQLHREGERLRGQVRQGVFHVGQRLPGAAHQGAQHQQQSDHGTHGVSSFVQPAPSRTITGPVRHASGTAAGSGQARAYSRSALASRSKRRRASSPRRRKTATPGRSTSWGSAWSTATARSGI